jgi:adenine deaminase
MATINVARAFGLDHRIGSIAPGRYADMVIVKDLHDFDVEMVFINGKRMDFKNSPLPRYQYPRSALNTVKMSLVSAENFRIEAPIKSGETTVRVMTLQDGSIATKEEEGQLNVEHGLLTPDISKDLLKIAVFDRYRANGHSAFGIVRGFGLKDGAFAGSIGQDSQNLVVVGTNDKDMAAAVNAIIEMQGGVAAVNDGKILAAVNLPIGGIMSDIKSTDLQAEFHKLHKSLASLGCKRQNPSFDLSLMLTCAVIPELKITNRGLVDALSGEFVPLFKSEVI